MEKLKRKSKEYWEEVKQTAAALKGDGCTSAPDLFYRKCCDEHDIHYRTHKTLNGKPITRTEADKLFFKCLRKTGKTPVIGRFFLPVVYWAGVRLFGRASWDGET